MSEEVIIFKQYQLAVGDKIHIVDGRRKGDWLVVEIDNTKLKLRCPLSGREFSWNRFCYAVEKREQAWPLNEE